MSRANRCAAEPRRAVAASPSPIRRLRWLALAATAAAATAVPGVSLATPTDSTLANITLSAGMLGSPFDSSVTSYTVSEPAGQSSITVTPMANDPSATVKVNGASVAFSTASSPIALSVGHNTITIAVTSQDTSTTTNYTLDVTRAASANADLSSLVISAGTLTPSFDPATTSYTASVTTGTASVTITPTLSDTNATMTVNASAATSGAAFGPVSLNYGTNAIGVTVTAQDGTTTQSYTVTITRPTPGTAQTITFNNPGAQNFGTAPTLSASSTSGLTVSFSSSTTGVCTITSGGALTFVSAGTCTINADQAGDGTYAAATTVTQSFSVNAVVPGAPTIGTATAGDTQASVAFTAPASTGGTAITGYTVTANPGGATGTCASSPCTVTGLTNGTAYTFTVTATNSAGTGSASAASNPATPKAAQTITFANPGAQNFGTTPTLTAASTSSLTVSFSSSTSGVCTITSGGALTFVSTGTCTIAADQAGNGSFLAATTVTRSFGVNAVVPGAPTIGAVTPGNGQVSIAFTAPASNGGAPITGYTATANPGGAMGTCASSPCVVTGLTNGTGYTFTVTATNSAGTGSASAASGSATPAVSSNDATLSALALSTGTLSPAFAGGTTSYAASVANGTSSITVTPTVNESHATVTVNGTTVTSGSPSGAIGLAVGSNTVTVLVTAQDGTTTRTYTITVTRAAAPAPPPVRSSNANLSALTLSSGTLDRAFAASDTAPYKATVSSGTTSITVTATTADSNATVEISAGGAVFAAATSGVAYGPVSLSLGTTAIVVRVTAQSGATRLYEVFVTRAAPPANNADLSAVQICVSYPGSAGVCSSPSFDPATTEYTIQAVGSFQIQATAADPGATVRVRGGSATIGTAAAIFTAPATAVTPVGVTVTSRDKSTTKTYTFTFGIPRPSADLSALGVSAGTLSPAFDPATVGYAVAVGSDVSAITLTPTASDPAATIQVKNRATDQVVSGPVALTAGATTSLSVTVTATDKTPKTYYVNVSRPAQLTITAQGSLAATAKVGSAWTATFATQSPDITHWKSTDLPPGLALTENALPGSPSATISGTPTKAGTYSFTLSATANMSGASGSLTQTLTVLDGPSDADLGSLRVETASPDQALSPKFDRSISEYTVTVPAETSSIGVAGQPVYQGAWIQVAVNGQTVRTSSFNTFDVNVPLTGASTKITVVTTLGSSSTTYDGASRTYTLTVNRVAAAANANLQGLSLGAGGTLSTPFAPDTLAYTATTTHDTTSLQIFAPTADPNAKLKLDGRIMASPMTVPLSVGDNVHKIAVTSADGTVTKTYTLTITRASSADLGRLSFVDATMVTDISAPVSDHSVSALSPSFNAGTTTYTATATHGAQVVMLGAQAVDSGAIVTVNGARISDEPAQFALNDGDNVFTVKVLGVDRVTTKTYTLTVTRAGPTLTIVKELPGATTGTAYGGSLTVLGGTGPYTFARVVLSGAAYVLPPGLTLTADGKFAGTPTSSGTYTIGVRATDSKGATGEGVVSLDIASSVAIQQTFTLTTSVGLSGQNLDTLKLSLANQMSQALGVSSSSIAITVIDNSGSSPAPAAASPAAFAGKGSAGPMSASAGQTAASGSGPILTYTPLANGMGLDHIVVSGVGLDGAPTAVALNIQVPGKAPDLTASVAANGLARLDPTAALVGGPFMGLKILAPPAYGQVSVSGLQLIYTPDPTHMGATTFVYAVDLGFGLSAPGTVTITTGQAVTAPSLTATAYAGQKVSLDLTTAAQGGPFTGAAVVSISPSSAGTAAIRSTGTGTYALDFTPSTSFTGPATVTYALAGAGAGYAQADATITVLARPDPSVDADLRGLISASDQAVRTFARTQTDNFNGRLESLRSGGGRGGFDMKLGFAAPSSGEDPRDMPGWRLRRLAQQGAPDPTARSVDPATGQRATDAPTGLGDAARPKPSAFGSWVAGVIQIGHVDGASQRRDYRLSTSGISAGVDYRLSDHLVIGAGLGYGEDKAKVGSKGSRLDGESKVGAAYGSWLPRPGVFVDGVLGYGKLSFDVTRYSAEADKLLTGSRSGDMAFGSFRAGYEGQRGPLRVSPYGQVSFIDGRLDSFTETGDAAFALRYYQQDVRSLAATLGLKLEGQKKIGRERSLTPRFRIEWRHEFDSVGDQALSYADWVGSPRYVVPGDQLGRDEGSIELGGRLQMEHQLSIDLGYRSMFSSSMRSGTWTLRLDQSF